MGAPDPTRDALSFSITDRTLGRLPAMMGELEREVQSSAQAQADDYSTSNKSYFKPIERQFHPAKIWSEYPLNYASYLNPKSVDHRNEDAHLAIKSAITAVKGRNLALALDYLNLASEIETPDEPSFYSLRGACSYLLGDTPSAMLDANIAAQQDTLSVEKRDDLSSFQIFADPIGSAREFKTGGDTSLPPSRIDDIRFAAILSRGVTKEIETAYETLPTLVGEMWSDESAYLRKERDLLLAADNERRLGIMYYGLEEFNEAAYHFERAFHLAKLDGNADHDWEIELRRSMTLAFAKAAHLYAKQCAIDLAMDDDIGLLGTKHLDVQLWAKYSLRTDPYFKKDRIFDSIIDSNDINFLETWGQLLSLADRKHDIYIEDSEIDAFLKEMFTYQFIKTARSRKTDPSKAVKQISRLSTLFVTASLYYQNKHSTDPAGMVSQVTGLSSDEIVRTFIDCSEYLCTAFEDSKLSKQDEDNATFVTFTFGLALSKLIKIEDPLLRIRWENAMAEITRRGARLTNILAANDEILDNGDKSTEGSAVKCLRDSVRAFDKIAMRIETDKTIQLPADLAEEIVYRRALATGELAEALIDAGTPDKEITAKAQELRAAAKERYPNSPRFQLTYGWVAYYQDKKDKKFTPAIMRNIGVLAEVKKHKPKPGELAEAYRLLAWSLQQDANNKITGRFAKDDNPRIREKLISFALGRGKFDPDDSKYLSPRDELLIGMRLFKEAERKVINRNDRLDTMQGLFNANYGLYRLSQEDRYLRCDITALSGSDKPCTPFQAGGERYHREAIRQLKRQESSGLVPQHHEIAYGFGMIGAQHSPGSLDDFFSSELAVDTGPDEFRSLLAFWNENNLATVSGTILDAQQSFGGIAYYLQAMKEGSHKEENIRDQLIRMLAIQTRTESGLQAEQREANVLMMLRIELNQLAKKPSPTRVALLSAHFKEILSPQWSDLYNKHNQLIDGLAQEAGHYNDEIPPLTEAAKRRYLREIKPDPASAGRRSDLSGSPPLTSGCIATRSECESDPPRSTTYTSSR